MFLHVGCRTVATFDPDQHAHLTSWLLYPSQQATTRVGFGAYELDLAMDAPVAAGAGRLPLVALSHGNGSTPWVHRGLALHLAREGFAVLMIEHPGNNRNDNSLGVQRRPGGGGGRVKTVLLEHRPRNVRLAVDAALADPLVGSALDGGCYSVIGESIGAYTALALAGGHAMALPDDVDRSQLTGPTSALEKLAFPVPTDSDARLRAAVLLSPAIAFFMAEGALADVTIPLLVRVAALDSYCPPAQIRFALRSLPDPAQLELAEVEGAGHFSFQSPYPLERAYLASAKDPPGFERASYQATLKQDVTAFLRAGLG